MWFRRNRRRTFRYGFLAGVKASWSSARRHWSVIVGGLVGVPCLVLVIVFLCRRVASSSYLTLRQVVVIGNERYDDGDVVAGCGLRVGRDNVLLLSVSEAERRCMANMDLYEAEVDRYLPSRLVIRVKERKPVMFVAYQGNLWLVDELGVAYRPIEPLEMRPLPILTGVDHLKLDSPEWTRVVSQAVSLLRLLRKHPGPFREDEVLDIAYVRGVGLAVESLERDLRVVFGRGEYEARVWRLSKAVLTLRSRGLEIRAAYLDNEEDPRVVFVSTRESTALARNEVDR